jgi:hypothetical protein
MSITESLTCLRGPRADHGKSPDSRACGPLSARLRKWRRCCSNGPAARRGLPGRQTGARSSAPPRWTGQRSTRGHLCRSARQEPGWRSWRHRQSIAESQDWQSLSRACPANAWRGRAWGHRRRDRASEGAWGTFFSLTVLNQCFRSHDWQKGWVWRRTFSTPSI